MSIELTVAISIAAAVIGAVLGLVGARRTSKRDASDEGRVAGQIASDISYIKISNTQMSAKLDSIADTQMKQAIEIAKAAAAAASAHRRIDMLEGRPPREN